MITNKCKYLTVRSLKYKKYFYCRNSNIKSKIDLKECSGCEYKEYNEQKSISVNKKPRTIALSIPQNVKEKVWERDKHKCVNCQKYVSISNACCHFVARSQGGLGIEENILTLCNDCHFMFDNTDKRQELKEKFRNYLQSKYINWNEENLVYKKGGQNGDQIGIELDKEYFELVSKRIEEAKK